jgi:hypothetical protein
MSRTGKLKVVYAIALANIAVLALWGVVFDVPDALGAFGLGGPDSSGILLGVDAFLAICFLICAAPVVFLVRRPMGWGKLLLPFYGASWILHAGMFVIMTASGIASFHIVGLWVPAACGGLMFALVVAHQIVDPTFFPRST